MNFANVQKTWVKNKECGLFVEKMKQSKTVSSRGKHFTTRFQPCALKPPTSKILSVLRTGPEILDSSSSLVAYGHFFVASLRAPS